MKLVCLHLRPTGTWKHESSRGQRTVHAYFLYTCFVAAYGHIQGRPILVPDHWWHGVQTRLILYNAILRLLPWQAIIPFNNACQYMSLWSLLHTCLEALKQQMRVIYIHEYHKTLFIPLWECALQLGGAISSTTMRACMQLIHSQKIAIVGCHYRNRGRVDSCRPR